MVADKIRSSWTYTRARTGLHIYLTHREFVLYVGLIFRLLLLLLLFGCEILVVVVTVIVESTPPCRPLVVAVVVVVVKISLPSVWRRRHIYMENLTTPRAAGNNNHSERCCCCCWPYCYRLETVHLELVWLCQARLGQPLANVFPLVALQLQNLTVLGMLNHSAIARKFLLTCSHDLLQVVLRRQALHGG